MGFNYGFEKKKFDAEWRKHRINDNVNTSDEDRELRFTIMATLAQDESRKIFRGFPLLLFILLFCS